MKKFSFLFISISILPSLSYSDVIKSGRVDLTLREPSPDAEGFSIYGGAYIENGEVTINKGEKIKFYGKTLIGNHHKRNLGILRVDGEGTILKTYEPLTVGNQGANAELHVTNGAEVIQVSRTHEDNYWGHWRDSGPGEYARIFVDGKNSKLTYKNHIDTYWYSSAHLFNGGTFNLDYKGPMTVFHIENQGRFNAPNGIYLEGWLKIGSDDHQQPGEFNFAKGIKSTRNGVRFIFKKLKEDNITFPLLSCDNCNIEYDATEKMKIDSSPIPNSPVNGNYVQVNNLEIRQGSLELDNQSTFRRPYPKFCVNTHFT